MASSGRAGRLRPGRVPGSEVFARTLPLPRARRRERAWQLLEAGAVNRQKLRTLLTAHGMKIDIDDEP